MRGLVGVTQYTQKGHIARAALEAACFQTKAILDAMEKDSGQALRRLAVDGGMSNSDLCMQVRIISHSLEHKNKATNTLHTTTTPTPVLQTQVYSL
jgi:glycerol kinase